MTASQIHERVLAGELVRAASQTYRFAAAPPTYLQALAIAVLSRPHAFVSGRSAAWLLGLDSTPRPVNVEITVPPTASGRSPAATVRRSQHFANVGLVTVDGLPCADVPETIFRMAEYVSPFRIGRLLDDALLAEPDVATELGEIYLRHQGERMKGMARLRPILLDRLSMADAPNESELEALADEVFAGLDCPPLRKQAPIPWALTSGRVDRFIPEWGVVIELDGRRWHARTAAFEADRARDNAAVAAGFAVLRFTWQTLKRQPERCRQLILDAGTHSMVE